MKTGPKPMDWETRLMNHVIPIPECGCWLWNASVDDCGYGKFTIKRTGKYLRAHRVSWELFIGEIPSDKQINHKCHVPSCVNPNHLYLGTQQQNIKDMWFANRGPKRNCENNGNAKLSIEQVQEIRNSNLETKYLADKFSVERTTIQRIRSGKRWR